MSRPLPLDLLNLSVGSIPDVMASPPTTTRGVTGANSTIRAGATISTATILPTSPKLTYRGCGGKLNRPAAAPSMYVQGAHINNGTSYTHNWFSVCFMTDAPEFDFAVYDNTGSYMVWIDGRPVSREIGYPTYTDSGTAYHKVSFGADVMTYRAEAVSLVSGGAGGYLMGEILSVSGGTASEAAQVVVRQRNGSGVILGLSPSRRGDYTAKPANPVTLSGGSGTGATCNITWGQRHTTRRMRRVELVFASAAAFGGINVPNGCVVQPLPAIGETWVFVGDSFQEGAYQSIPAMSWGIVAAEALGVRDTAISYGLGSIGYSAISGSRPNFLGMVPDIVALKPTRMVVGLGINDLSTDTNLSDRIASAYAQLAAQIPNCLFFCLGPWVAPSGSLTGAHLTKNNMIKAAFESVIPARRGTFCDTAIGDVLINPDGTDAGSAPGSGNTGQWTSSDGTHFGGEGHVYLGYGVANAVVRGAQRILAAA